MPKPLGIGFMRLPLVMLGAVCAGLAAGPAADAGGLIRAPAVGGVYIDAEGVVSAPAVDGAEALQATWQAGLTPVPGDLEPLTDLRFVSLRKLDAEIASCNKRGEPLPDSVRYLAGLLRVKHVLVYPPQQGSSEPGDIVLAGPAEGWRVDSLGNTVGATTGRPVVMLEDLVVALRAAEGSNGPGISCSIDPTPEGLVRVQSVQRELTAAEGPQSAARKLEQALGRQVISVTGVPGSSHFARSLVAADFRMKRLAMGFEPSPIGGLPSYLSVVEPRTLRANVLPRWWLAASYEPLARDAQGLAWEIRGQGVKCLSEEDLVDGQGKLERGAGGNTGPAARWAAMMTARFEELADHDSAFGQLRNALDLSVAAALMAKESLWQVAKVEAPWLAEKFDLERYNAPQSVATQASFVKKGRQWVVTASGGVQVFPWQIADQTKEVASLAPVAEAGAQQSTSWWWQ
ncbi:MAG: DUF1598 domain-containing protein [Lacipirellulaceae bacterium]